MTQDLTLIEKADRAAFTSGAMPKALVPTTFDAVWILSDMIVQAKMAPKDFTSAMCTIAIMHGLEVGLTPMAALQSIAVVNGRPTIWGDGALALVRASGLCESFREWIEGDGVAATATCEILRRGDPVPIVGAFSMQDAKTAGLDTKDIWKKYPKRMLQMRARAFAMRDGFADILKGMGIREEVNDYDDDDRRPPRLSPTKADISGKLAEGRKASEANHNPSPVKREDERQTIHQAAVAKAADSPSPQHGNLEIHNLDQLHPEKARQVQVQVEAADKKGKYDGEAVQGEEPEGEAKGTASTPDANQGRDGAIAVVRDTADGAVDAGGDHDQQEVRDGEDGTSDGTLANAVDTGPADDGLPPGNWTPRQKKKLANIVRDIAKAKLLAEVRDVVDGYREIAKLETPEFQAAYTAIVEAREKIIRASSSARSRL